MNFMISHSLEILVPMAAFVCSYPLKLRTSVNITSSYSRIGSCTNFRSIGGIQGFLKMAQNLSEDIRMLDSSNMV